jgi:thiol-disulfide isomerase/thioredoxin
MTPTKLLARAGLAALLLLPVLAQGETRWTRPAGDGETLILYYFYSDTCPHCQEARPFVTRLGEKEWIEVQAREVTKNRDNARMYVAMAAELGEKARSVPGFLFCGRMQTGYDTAETTGASLLAQLEACRADPQAYIAAHAPKETGAATAAPAPEEAQVPVLGNIDADKWALPVLTVVIAGLDAFNPCAFFVLLFLLSIMVHAGSRARMLAVGAVFVTISGLVYFAFMAAWLNAFLLIGELRAVTVIAGIVAIGLALVNVKDYFWFQKGPSLSIPESKKPGLFQRMRSLVGEKSLWAMLTGTALLAIAANSYELLCTAGFPMVYTRILTLREVDPLVYYLYLGLYNVVYVIPLMIIVSVFVLRFGQHKLSEREGRVLKLLSGMMMLALGGVMLLAPAALNQVGVAVGLLAVAALSTWLIHVLYRRRGLI